MKILFVQILIVLLLVTSSCGDESGDSSSNLVGEWKSDCESAGSLYITKSISFFSNSRYEYIEVTFGDQTCLSTPMTALTSTGYYSEVGSAGQLIDVDFEIEVIDLTIKNEDLASSYNNNSYCGIGNWNVEVSQSLVGVDCSISGADTISFAGIDDAHQQIIEVNLDNGRLFIGDMFLEVLNERQSSLASTIFLKQG